MILQTDIRNKPKTMKNAVFWVVRRVSLVRSEVSEERIASIIRVTRISKLETMLAANSIYVLATNN
jgi:hypothetical protein